jgi:hypothetical protein
MVSRYRLCIKAGDPSFYFEWSALLAWILGKFYRTVFIKTVKTNTMENEELERSVTIVGMVLLLVTFLMGVLESFR